MASRTRIPQAEPTGLYGALVKRMSRRMFGEVPEPLGVSWHNRKVLNFSFGVGRKAQKWDQCDENLKSFAHMAIASLIGCSFCLDFGYYHAHNRGLDVNKAPRGSTLAGGAVSRSRRRSGRPASRSRSPIGSDRRPGPHRPGSARAQGHRR